MLKQVFLTKDEFCLANVHISDQEPRSAPETQVCKAIASSIVQSDEDVAGAYDGRRHQGRTRYIPGILSAAECRSIALLPRDRYIHVRVVADTGSVADSMVKARTRELTKAEQQRRFVVL